MNQFLDQSHAPDSRMAKGVVSACRAADVTVLPTLVYQGTKGQGTQIKSIRDLRKAVGEELSTMALRVGDTVPGAGIAIMEGEPAASFSESDSSSRVKDPRHLFVVVLEKNSASGSTDPLVCLQLSFYDSLTGPKFIAEARHTQGDLGQNIFDGLRGKFENFIAAPSERERLEAIPQLPQDFTLRNPLRWDLEAFRPDALLVRFLLSSAVWITPLAIGAGTLELHWGTIGVLGTVAAGAFAWGLRALRKGVEPALSSYKLINAIIGAGDSKERAQLSKMFQPVLYYFFEKPNRRTPLDYKESLVMLQAAAIALLSGEPMGLAPFDTTGMPVKPAMKDPLDSIVKGLEGTRDNWRVACRSSSRFKKGAEKLEIPIDFEAQKTIDWIEKERAEMR